jgi:hypothetical protein
MERLKITIDQSSEQTLDRSAGSTSRSCQAIPSQRLSRSTTTQSRSHCATARP